MITLPPEQLIAISTEDGHICNGPKSWGAQTKKRQSGLETEKLMSLLAAELKIVITVKLYL